MKDYIKPKGYTHARKRYKGPLYWLADFRTSRDFQGLAIVLMLALVAMADFFAEQIGQLVESGLRAIGVV